MITQKLNKETQMIAVEKVLEEMQSAEEFVNNWNASWAERCLDAYSIPLYYTGMSDVQDIEEKYHNHYVLPNVYYPENRIGEPLKKVILSDYYGKEYECEFGRIDWEGMKSHKSRRYFSFNNNGDINFSKDAKIKQTKHPYKHISYNASYNVLSNDFIVNIKLDQLIQDWKKIYKDDYLTFSLNGNILTKKFNDIEIIQDLSTKKKLIRIIKKYDKHNKSDNASVVFEAILNQDNNLEIGAVAINTHKSNGKINGTYRFDVSKEKGVRANFYSRKGIKVDLTTNPILLETANKSLLPKLDNQNSSDMIISNFTNSTQNAIAKNLTERIISFDNADFNLDSVRQAETKIIEMIKCIKGELPLPGLVERINNCLSLIEMNKNLQISDNPKILKLKTQNK